MCNKCLLSLYYDEPEKYSDLVVKSKWVAFSNNVYQKLFDEK
jgi:hypothetical protein